MARFLVFVVILMFAAAVTAMAELESAYPSHPSNDFVPVPNVEDAHVQYLGEFAVKRYNEQTKGYLKFLHVGHAEVLHRGTDHYTYILIVKVHESYKVKLYKIEVFQDLGAPEEPPVLNLGYFEPL